uniref:Uncharacterized protein n=1 Tax=Cacopsylla melanoneura TaxID=428564 RepID=A0A8D8ZQN3_9HEMI
MIWCHKGDILMIWCHKSDIIMIWCHKGVFFKRLWCFIVFAFDCFLIERKIFLLITLVHESMNNLHKYHLVFLLYFVSRHSGHQCCHFTLFCLHLCDHKLPLWC